MCVHARSPLGPAIINSSIHEPRKAVIKQQRQNARRQDTQAITMARLGNIVRLWKTHLHLPGYFGQLCEQSQVPSQTCMPSSLASWLDSGSDAANRPRSKALHYEHVARLSLILA
eukprot:10210253-Alexandrium_andersonii.AAC.1